MRATVMEHLGIPAYEDQEVNEITRHVAPVAVLDALERQDAGHQN